MPSTLFICALPPLGYFFESASASKLETSESWHERYLAHARAGVVVRVWGAWVRVGAIVIMIVRGRVRVFQCVNCVSVRVLARDVA
jgi:hypothetical protein